MFSDRPGVWGLPPDARWYHALVWSSYHNERPKNRGRSPPAPPGYLAVLGVMPFSVPWISLQGLIESDEQNTAFTMPLDLYEYNRRPQGQSSILNEDEHLW